MTEERYQMIAGGHERAIITQRRWFFVNRIDRYMMTYPAPRYPWRGWLSDYKTKRYRFNRWLERTKIKLAGHVVESKTSLYHGARSMVAPNRYRKLLKVLDKRCVYTAMQASKASNYKLVPVTIVDETDSWSASPALHLWGISRFQKWPEVRAAILDLQKKEFPLDAHRAMGIEPNINLVDVILVWSGSQPLASDPGQDPKWITFVQCVRNWFRRSK